MSVINRYCVPVHVVGLKKNRIYKVLVYNSMGNVIEQHNFPTQQDMDNAIHSGQFKMRLYKGFIRGGLYCVYTAWNDRSVLHKNRAEHGKTFTDWTIYGCAVHRKYEALFKATVGDNVITFTSHVTKDGGLYFRIDTVTNIDTGRNYTSPRYHLKHYADIREIAHQLKELGALYTS